MLNIKVDKSNHKKKVIIGVVVFVIVLIIAVIASIFWIENEYQHASIKHADENSKVQDELNKKVELGEVNIKKPKSIHAVVPIFMYHFVRDDTGDYEYPENMTKVETLRQQLQYLKENGYETIYKDEIGHLEHFTKPVWLTFDDGWEDFYINAFPLFKEYQMKASFYVITGLVGTPGYCNLEQLKEMKESGLIDIQSHTVTHPKLATLKDDKIKEELTQSKIYLKEKLEIDSNVICYPYGSFNQKVKNISKEIGYQYGLAMDGGVYKSDNHKDIFAIPRIYAMRSMSMKTFSDYVKQSKVTVKW